MVLLLVESDSAGQAGEARVGKLLDTTFTFRLIPYPLITIWILGIETSCLAISCLGSMFADQRLANK